MYDKKLFWNKTSARHYLILLALLLLFGFLYFTVDDFINATLLFLGVSLIIIFNFGSKNQDYFSPLFLFSIYYMLIYVVAFNIVVNGLNQNYFLNSTLFYNSISDVYTITLLVCIISYVSTLSGYYLFARKMRPQKPYIINEINSSLFLIVALTFFGIGLFNFAYNIYSLYGGNVVNYYINISMRSYDYQYGGTTLGYKFLYTSAYMMFIRSIQMNKHKLLSLVIIICSIIVYSSGGRIIGTLMYCATFFAIYYYNFGASKINNKFFILGVIFPIAGITFYFLRLASSLNYNGMFNFSHGGIIDYAFEVFSFDNLIYFLIDKGNLPNFAVLMKVVDSWGRDIGYMFGITFLYPLYGFLSSNLFGYIEMPSVIAKQVWYSHVLGGNLPITIMGEMIANFSFFGTVFGMFIFGMLGACIRNRFYVSRSNIYLIFYSQFSFFYMISPKGEFNNFNLIWFCFSSLVILFIIYFVRTFRSSK